MKKIRKNILILCIVLIALFSGLGVTAFFSFTGNWDRWLSSEYNVGNRKQKASVIAGDIIDRNGTLLAWTNEAGERVYQTEEAARRSTVHVVGDTQNNVNHGAESFLSRYLYGYEFTLEESQAALTADQVKGDNVYLSIDAKLCKAINSYYTQAFPDRSGAVVVMNWKTGELLAEMSFPNYDPMNVTDAVKNNALKPFWNRAVQMQKAPGSTFKIITTACALQNISYARETAKLYTCTGLLSVGNRTITDAGTTGTGNKDVIVSHGDLTLKKAFSVSCNNTYAYLSLLLGDSRLKKTAEDFGFNDNFLFSDVVCENSVYPTTNRTELEIAWTGAGQSALMATPLHMCMVASAVANGGVMMEPKLVLGVRSQSGIIRTQGETKVYRKAIDADTAAVLKEYMRAVVTEGTGKNANVDGHMICGKTGSSERDGQEDTDAWFVGFIGEESSPYALCVVIEDAGGGGTNAAPIAGKIFKYLLRN